MAIQNWSNDTLLVDLPDTPNLQEELQEVARLVQDRGVCDVVMDFSAVTVIHSTCLATLLRLRKQLLHRGRRLILCNIGRVTHSILSVTGVTGVFDIRADKFDALATVTLQHPTSSSTRDWQSKTRW